MFTIIESRRREGNNEECFFCFLFRFLRRRRLRAFVPFCFDRLLPLNEYLIASLASQPFLILLSGRFIHSFILPYISFSYLFSFGPPSLC